MRARNVLAIDPGVHFYGEALFHAGALIAVGYRERSYIADHRWTPSVIVIEIPEVYHDRRNQKGDLNDLIDLAFAAGEIRILRGRNKHGAPVPAKHVRPKEWKGQLPKEACANRVRSRLSASETRALEAGLALVPRSKWHNVLDAVGIGLHTLDRGPLHG